jgi:hypothetical protein
MSAANPRAFPANLPAPILRMKRLELSLGLLLGGIVGMLCGTYFGQSISEPAPSQVFPAASAPPPPTERAETNMNGADAAAPTVEAWVKSYIAHFPEAEPGMPTPHIKEAVLAARQASSPINTGRLMALIDQMRKEDFPLMLEVLRASNGQFDNVNVGSEGPPVWIAFWNRFGELDPAAALAAALGSADLKFPNRENMERHLFSGMARTDPAAAAEAYLAHPELANRDNAAGGLIFAWSRKDPAAAAAWAQQNLQGKTMTSALQSMAWGVSRGSNIGPANALLRDVADPDGKRAVAASIRSQIRRKPETSFNQVFEYIDLTRNSGLRDEAFEREMAIRFADRDPFAAAEFFSRPLADDQAGNDAELKLIAARWARNDYKAATAWAKGQETAPHYALIAREFALAAAERNDAAEVERWKAVAGGASEGVK